MSSRTKRIATGIDVGTHATRVVIVEHSRGEAPIIIGTGISETRGLRHGYIVNKSDAIRSIKNAITNAEKMVGFKIKNAILSIGGISLESSISHGTTIISRASSEVTELDLRKASAEAEENLSHLTNKRIIHRIPLRYKLDNKEVLGDPIGMTGTKLDTKMLFITCLEQHLDDIIRTIEELGVEVDEVVPSPIAAGMVALSKKQRSVGCALVNIGAETVSIAVFENDTPISLQIFPIGSTDVTNDIALGLKIPLQEAEKIKLSGPEGIYSKKKLDEIIEARLYDIFELIDSHLKKIGRSGLLPAGVVLTGGGTGVATIEDLARAVLKLPSSIAHPAITSGGKHVVKDSSWLVAYGLAVYALQKPGDTSENILSDIIETLKNWVRPFLP
ncbi:MAG: cell division protein FtsA [Candidatus Yonathbacteria bacterium CG10_big_fil_rev_8_21_14_0_10_43_136]|uniref:Cell division protein FtsA n=1 Tax=Candidatus Yonathbacteria bacterium CG_4_10_14_0_8_um_filter_43_17 TaxID=1975099 RepID=A0A2M7Q5C6_9BACT|nr:MAG: cell division protein FtsA [Candidatus Yonathbacteria bacterium CG17_big_fil_post_rev_8_21_14_2_50_43_9]PIR40662.1 MAG: cell division protein FtsA [Candidatus Yonathbacteria bacterium CG10_big_fil_rev_8_21_14_0_10_43_136]PIY58593.1 MAG: cell division protein FtsA [Candidatus Yonathbacteria bacterium CG_4_10_14_0_8_um_filter_43_17]PJC22367.1 MAG: cell division protein FtsA [Candidatus Yonathbacteria bacterium CG_4_9_14_0_2_um_filter_43_16]